MNAILFFIFCVTLIWATDMMVYHLKNKPKSKKDIKMGLVYTLVYLLSIFGILLLIYFDRKL